MYKQQSRIHIEFPRSGYPKIRAVEQHVGNPPVKYFVDACSGVGTLGLAAACLGVPHVVLNDAWYASAFWSAFNLEVNREYLRIDRVRIFEQEEDMQKHPVMKEPVKIAETEGEQSVEVYQGDFRRLHTVLSVKSPSGYGNSTCSKRVIPLHCTGSWMTGRKMWAGRFLYPDPVSLPGIRVLVIFSGKKPLLTSAQRYMGTSPGGSASLVTRNRRYAGGEV